MSGSAECRNQPPRGERAQQSILVKPATRSPERERKSRAFLLTKTYMDARNTAAITSNVHRGLPSSSLVFLHSAVHISGNQINGISQFASYTSPGFVSGIGSKEASGAGDRCHECNFAAAQAVVLVGTRAWVPSLPSNRQHLPARKTGPSFDILYCSG